MIRSTILIFIFVAGATAARSDTVRLATYNVLNYLTMDRRVEGRYRPDYPKPEKEKTAVRRDVHRTAPDVLALQEFGPAPYLEEFRQDLAREGTLYEHSFLLEAADPERRVAILSKTPFLRIVEHPAVEFTYFEEFQMVKRGMIQAVFDAPDGEWTLFVIHLKSRYSDRPDDPNSEERRVREARKLRDIVLKQFPDPQTARFAIAGDFNDTKNSRAVRAFLKRGKTTISEMVPTVDSRGESWTYRYKKEAIYSRSDYILVSPGLLPDIIDGRGVVLDGPDSLSGSDHRMIFVDFDLRAPEDAG